MKHLLDVNMLVALGHESHDLHVRALQWAQSHRLEGLGLCSVVEMGFLRVSVNAGLQSNVAEAKDTLNYLRWYWSINSVTDDITAEDLPDYVKAPKQVTDGHLLALARRHDLQLVTLDRGIPSAHLVK